MVPTGYAVPAACSIAPRLVSSWNAVRPCGSPARSTAAWNRLHPRVQARPIGGTGVDVGAWLRGLGLERYEPVFRDNEIDAAVLPKLTAEHLKELGLPLGPRLKLLEAIAGLRDAATPPVPVPAVAPPVAGADQRTLGRMAEVVERRSPEAERRQLTVMFCDLVGSAALSGRLDPEEMRELIRAYQNTVAGEITRFEGHVAKYMGDGVLAYFGYPRAHEDDAERAVLAGLAAVQAIGRLRSPDHGEPLAARVGIATGVVIIGDLIGEGAAQEEAVVGETPNLAARLQALAQPDAVLIGPATRPLIGGAFEIEELGPQTLKGFAAPVPVWRVTGTHSVESRFEARSTGPSLLVGREQEVALLLDRWGRSKDGEGQAVLLSGEPGIGKSRIVRAICEHAEREPHLRLRYQCSPHYTSTAFHPVIEQLERAAGLARDDPNPAKLAKLEALLAQGVERVSEAAPLIAAMLSIPTAGRYPPLAHGPQRRRELTIEVLVEQVLGLARQKPVLCIFEDLHWADPSTLDVLGPVIDRISAARVLLLLTCRPEFVPPWKSLSHVTVHPLNRLERHQSATLVEGVTRGKALPHEVLDQIVAKTDGVPLFVEELTKTVLEAGFLQEEADRYVLAGPLPPLAIPSTLRDSLVARLDRLAPVKEVAQIGAAIGREFGYELLAAVSRLGDNELQDALAQLAAAELVFARGSPPAAVYTFKHALVQDAAYRTLLKSKRRQLHARIAETLTARFPDVEARTPELLARHYAEAGLDDRAKHYWTLAGRQALAGSKYAEASSHLANALALARKTPPSGERVREEAQLLLDQTQAVVALRGPGSVETGRIAAEAVGVSEPLGDDVLHFRARWADWISKSMSGDLPTASDRADQLVAMADRTGSAEMRLQAHHARWTTAFLRGQVAVTRDAVEHGLALYDFDQHRDHLAIYGAHDPGVCARGTGACVLWQAGFAARAAGLSLEATRLADELGHTFSRAVAYWQAGFLSMMTGDPEGARTWAEALAELVARTDVALASRMAEIIGGWAATRLGEPGRGAERMEAAYRGLLEAKQLAYLTFLGTLIAGARLETGRAEEALGFLDDVERLSVETHQRMFMPDLHRLRAEALRRLGSDGRRIGEEYRLAVRLARRQGAPALELRAATGLARWLADTNRREQAHELLRPTYGLFTDGFDTPDLRDARALLEEFR
jgi:class 3 adenylate cyclase